MNRGILYLAKGEEFVNEAKISAQRIAEVMPKYPIAIVTDQNIDAEYFDEVIIDSTDFLKRNKPQAMQKTPYERTLYLDTDIYLEDSVSELFDVLDKFELALRRNRDEYHIPNMADSTTNVPEAFPEFNTGVIPYRKTPAVMNLLYDWERRCLPEHESDQRTFRPALYHSSVRFTCFPNRYNCMYKYNNVVNKKVKVFHGPLINRERNEIDIDEAVDKINKSDEFRYYYAYEDTVFMNPSPILTTKLWIIFRNRGLYATMKSVFEKISGYR